MSIAASGHGATIAMELDPDGAQGVFTTIAELNGDLIGLGIMRPVDEVTPHQDTIDSSVTGVLKRDPWTFTVNFVHANTTHDGLRDALLTQTRTGFRFRGPGGGAGTHEVIQSGEVTAWKQTYPVRQGAQSAEVTIVPSKAFIIDGVSYGQAA